MRKYLVCISESISFVTDSFLYMLLITLPAMLLLALCGTYACYSGPLSIGGIIGGIGFLLSFLLLQGVIFRLWAVKQRGIEVSAQKHKSVYCAALHNVGTALNPMNWAKCLAFFFRHFSELFPLAFCLLLFYGTVFFVLSAPLVTIGMIRHVVSLSVESGDAVSLPGGLGLKFCIVLFLITYVLAVVSSVCLLPFKVFGKQILKDDKE